MTSCFVRNEKQYKAIQAVNVAVRAGHLIRPTVCELCGYDVTQPPDHGYEHPRICGHHYLGYDHPLDVWWICASCNRCLEGKHDGSLTKEQAREFVRNGGVPVRSLDELTQESEFLIFIGRLTTDSYSRFKQDAAEERMTEREYYVALKPYLQ